ncbi:MAG: hypothetical protein DMG39_19125 [Acidobacteria bacterium]|nr:MAG: hypothetical protein DMG39_19125 [Acidobacteriota bacterium]
METVKVSPKFQVVIPEKIREELQLKPGQELQVFFLGETTRLRRPRSIKELRGIAKGMKWKDDYRDHPNGSEAVLIESRNVDAGAAASFRCILLMPYKGSL